MPPKLLLTFLFEVMLACWYGKEAISLSRGLKTRLAIFESVFLEEEL